MAQYWFNEIELPNGGRLGLGCCPGHRLMPLAVMRAPGTLGDDLAVIAAWQPDLVLSLMEEDELAYVGAPVQLLADEWATLGIGWQHLPIPNLQPPDDRFEEAWVELWPRMDALFKVRGRVFIHCYAGLGRTGTLASLILMQYGFNARDAMIAVRKARPGSIETWSQERYLLKR